MASEEELFWLFVISDEINLMVFKLRQTYLSFTFLLQYKIFLSIDKRKLFQITWYINFHFITRFIMEVYNQWFVLFLSHETKIHCSLIVNFIFRVKGLVDDWLSHTYTRWFEDVEDMNLFESLSFACNQTISILFYRFIYKIETNPIIEINNYYINWLYHFI